jgi:general secretion pathway protein M
MNLAAGIGQLRERALAWWVVRTEQERMFLSIGAGVVLVALVYLVLVAPALDGRARLHAELPQLRQQDARLKALAAEAAALAGQPAPQVAPMTREALSASLSARGLTPASLTMTGEYAKLQFNGVSFAGLVAWLDAQRRENRVGLQDGAFAALAQPGQVDATLTLHQDSGAGSPAGVQ